MKSMKQKTEIRWKKNRFLRTMKLINLDTDWRRRRRTPTIPATSTTKREKISVTKLRKKRYNTITDSDILKELICYQELYKNNFDYLNEKIYWSNSLHQIFDDTKHLDYFNRYRKKSSDKPLLSFIIKILHKIKIECISFTW